MEIEKFFEKYGLAICNRFLRDNEINFSLYLNNNEIDKSSKLFDKDVIGVIETANILNSRQVEKSEMNKYLSLNDYDKGGENLTKFLSGRYSLQIKSERGYMLENEIDRFYFTEDDIEYLLNKDSKTFYLGELSRATGIIWSDNLIDKYKEEWYWYDLCVNRSVRWSIDRINKFKNYIDFSRLSGNENIEIDKYHLNKFQKKWDWNKLCGNPSVLNQVENIVLNHNKCEWKHNKTNLSNKNYNPYDIYTVNYEYEDYPSINPSGNVKPCISTNTSIFWNLEKFEKYKDKIDFWILAAYGNLSNEVIVKYGSILNENRIIGTRFTRSSDWRDQHPVYLNGWENWLKNRFTKIDIKTLVNIAFRDVEIYRHDGNARDGHSKYSETRKVKQFLRGRTLDINFKELYVNINYISTELISERHLDDIVYFNIIKPAFLSDKSLFNKMIYYM